MPNLTSDCLADFHLSVNDRINLALRRKALSEHRAGAGRAALGVAGISGFAGLAVRQYVWQGKSQLRVHFYESDFKAQVLKHVQEWTDHANLEFVEAAGEAASDIRVSFRHEPGKYWSLLGDQADEFRNRPTVNLGFSRSTPAKEIRRLVLHEFGHALGLQHEMKNPKAGLKWDKRRAIAHYSRMLPGLSEDQVWAQLQVYDNDSRRFLVRDFDPASIMMYPIDESLLESGWVKAMGNWNYDLSRSDTDIVREMYPGRGTPRPADDEDDEDDAEGDDAEVTEGERGELEVDGPALKDTIMALDEKDIFRFTIPKAGDYEIEAKGSAFVTLTVSGPGIDPPRVRNTPNRDTPAVYFGLFRKGEFQVEVTASGSDPAARGNYSIRLRQKP